MCILFSARPANAQVTVTIEEILPSADRDERINTVIDYRARVRFTVAAGDTNTYECRALYYFLKPDGTEEHSGDNGATPGSAAAGLPALWRVEGAKQVDQIGTWGFGVRTYYRVAGTSTWIDSTEEHYHINVYQGGGG